mgnify:FL=1
MPVKKIKSSILVSYPPGALIHGENCKSWHGQLHTEENPVYRNVLKTQNP